MGNMLNYCTVVASNLEESANGILCLHFRKDSGEAHVQSRLMAWGFINSFATSLKVQVTSAPSLHQTLPYNEWQCWDRPNCPEVMGEKLHMSPGWRTRLVRTLSNKAYGATKGCWMTHSPFWESNSAFTEDTLQLAAISLSVLCTGAAPQCSCW